VKDIDFDYKQIIVRDAKGQKDRITVLPVALIEPLKRQLQRVKSTHECDLRDGFGEVHLPFALARKYPNASREWAVTEIRSISRRFPPQHARTQPKEQFVDIEGIYLVRVCHQNRNNRVSAYP
jgi:integrase